MPVFVDVGATVVVVVRATVVVVVRATVVVVGATVVVVVEIAPWSVTIDSSPLGVHAIVTVITPITRLNIISTRRDCSVMKTGVVASRGVHVVSARTASAVSG